MIERPTGDYIVRVISRGAGIRAMACVTTELVQDAARRHRSTPVATAAMAYGLTGAALLGALLKVRQRVAMKVVADGPLRKLVAESDYKGQVRGYVADPDVTWPLPIRAAGVAEALGRHGTLTVVKDLGLPDLAESVVPVQTGEIDVDLVYYLNASEQVPSLVEIGVKMDDSSGRLKIAGGILLQTLPGAEASDLIEFADRLDDLPPLEAMLTDGQTPEQVLEALFGAVAYETLETQSLTFHCGCSWERSELALRLLGEEDLQALIGEGQAVVDCHFCHERYIFGREALEMILEQARGRSGST